MALSAACKLLRLYTRNVVQGKRYVAQQPSVSETDWRQCIQQDLTCFLQRLGSGLGFQAYPLQVGEYNKQVKRNWMSQAIACPMTLDYEYNTLAYVFVYGGALPDLGMEHKIASARLCLTQHILCLWPDFERARFISPNDMHVHCSTLPKMHMQLAGNASCGARYYQKSDVQHPPQEWDHKVIFGAAWNPEFEEKTLFGGVLILEDLQVPSFPPPPIHQLSQSEIASFLTKMNRMGTCSVS